MSFGHFFPHTSLAYARHTTGVLRGVLYFFQALSIGWIFRYVLPLLRPQWGNAWVFRGFIRRTLFAYFCGGERVESALVAAETVHKQGLYGILDYAVEEEASADEAILDVHCAAFERSITLSGGHAFLPFVAIKVSSLGWVPLMEQAQAQQASVDQQQIAAIKRRFDRLCQAAQRHGVGLLVDAEYYAFQDFVDKELVLPAMRRYNTERPVVYNTYQLYRHDAYDRLVRDEAALTADGVHFGVKLVRGAYMDYERRRAAEGRYPSPIHPTLEACHKAYDAALCYVLDRHERIGMVMGTHNKASCGLLISYARKQGIALDHPNIWASQLYGMGEALSYGLAAQGVRVAKYIPYGPYAQLLPYLYRRGIENAALSSQSQQEIRALAHELTLRKKSLNLAL